MPEYKDMLGKTLVVGQKALNVFIRSDGPSGEPIGHRLCEITKINPKSVRIRYKKKLGQTGESNIYNTVNRLIVLKESNGYIHNGSMKNRWEILDLRRQE